MKNEKKLLDMKLTISRPSGGGGEPYISLAVHDELSGMQFLDMRIGLADFSEAITGMGYVAAKGEVRGLQNIGKQRETEDASATITKEEYQRITQGPYSDHKPKLAAYLEANHGREGWRVNGYLGSQRSILHSGDMVTLNFSHTRYVEVADFA